MTYTVTAITAKELQLNQVNRLLQGLATIFVGIASYWMVHDFPDEAKFLSDADRARVIRRLKADKQSSAEHEEFKMDYFWASVKDWKTYAFSVIYMGCDGALYAFSLFLPTIINELVRPEQTYPLATSCPFFFPWCERHADEDTRKRATPAQPPTSSPSRPTPPPPS